MSVASAHYVVAKATALVEARRRAGLSQPKLAARADLSIVTVVRAERGDRIWSSSAFSLARVLEIDVDELFEGVA